MALQTRGAVVAQQASIPFVLKVHAAERRAAWLIDWLVHPDWRLKGVSPALFAHNAKTADIMLGLGLEEWHIAASVAPDGWMRRVVVVRARVRPRGVRKNPQIAGFGRQARAARDAGRQRLHSGALAAGVSRLALEPLAAFDERVDALWRSASDGFPVVAKRDFQAVRWRFDEGPQQPLFERYGLIRKGELLGYAVVRIANWRGYSVARMVDCFAHRNVLGALIALLIEELSRKTVVAAFFEQCHREAGALLRSLGCVRARPSHRVMFKLPVARKRSPRRWGMPQTGS